MGTTLTTLSVIAVAIVVLVLVVYLLLIIKTLYSAGSRLAELAAGLEQIAHNTQPLPEKLTTINSALGQIGGGLSGVDDDLAAVDNLLHS